MERFSAGVVAGVSIGLFACAFTFFRVYGAMLIGTDDDGMHNCLQFAAELYQRDKRAGKEWSDKYCWPENGKIAYPNSTR
jgi:hypothetical protein